MESDIVSKIDSMRTAQPQQVGSKVEKGTIVSESTTGSAPFGPEQDSINFQRPRTDEELRRANPAPRIPPPMNLSGKSSVSRLLESIVPRTATASNKSNSGTAGGLTAAESLKAAEIQSTAKVSATNSVKAISYVQSTLPNGIIIRRRYDTAGPGNVDAQAGTLAYWTTKVNEIQAKVSNYNRGTGQPSHFFEHVILDIYPPAIPLPNPSLNYASCAVG